LESNFGICDVRIDYFDSILIVTFNPAVISPDQVATALRTPGFKLRETLIHKFYRFIFCHINVLRLAVSGILVVASWAMNFSFEGRYNVRIFGDRSDLILPISYILINMLVIALAMWPRFSKAGRAIRKGRYCVEVFTLLAVGGAVLGGYWLEAATFSLVAVFVDAFDEIITAQTWQEYLNGTIANAKNAYIVEGNSTRKIPISRLKVGQLLSVRHGMLIPVDGRVVNGSGHIDESALIGENSFFKKGVGDKVYAGTLLESGSMIIEALKIGHDTTVAGISKLISHAQQKKESEIKKTVDSCAAWLTCFTMAYSSITFIIRYILVGEPLYDVLTLCLSIIFVSCPCALLLSTPLAIHVGVELAAKFGIIFRNGQVMEDFAKTKTILVDKTGTLTHARSVVYEMKLFSTISEKEILEKSMAIEGNSYHPLALAICGYAADKGGQAVPAEHYHDLAGGASACIDNHIYYIGSERLFKNMDYQFPAVINEWLKSAEAKGYAAVLLSDEHHFLAGYAFVDKIRDESFDVIKRLRAQGMEKIIMVTGDNYACAKRISEQLELDDFQSECFPESKLSRLLAIKAEENVAMIGDGINDAPAMAAATVGIVMVNTGTDAAIAAADIVLSGDTLDDLVLAYDLSRKVYRTIKFNITLSIALVALMLSLVSSRNLSLTQSTFLYVGSSLLILLSSYSSLVFTFPWVKRLGRRIKIRKA
jgi:Cd2+/Zn2+-exporting ATPase